jgi:superoxide dismutase, Cu-Zn family
MTHVKTFCLVAAMSAGLLCAGCKSDHSGTASTTQPATRPAGTADVKEAHATIKNSQANTTPVSGAVEFQQEADGVRVVVDVKGLTPGQHGIHVHEKGDLSDPKLVSAGPHFNPVVHKHGGPEGEMRHAGDFGNIEADAQGNARLDRVFKGITINGATDGIVGRSIIIHANADDLKTDPSGNSGDRIAGGKIEPGPK